MRKISLLLCLLPLVSFLFSSSLHAQVSQSYLNDTGSPPYGVLIPVENGYIDVSNGNLHLEFPLATYPQRGALQLDERLVYDSRIWMFTPYGSNGSYHWWPFNVPSSGSMSGGWRFVQGNEVGSAGEGITQSFYNSCSWGDDNQGTDEIDKGEVSWVDPSGVGHTFSGVYQQEYNSCTNTYTQSIQGGYATDGSGYTDADDGTGNPIITDNNGTQVYPSIVDRYGNHWSTDSSGNFTDDTGRIPIMVSSGYTGYETFTYYDVLAPNGPLSNNGTRVRYIVTSSPISVTTSFGQQDTYEDVAGTIWPVTSIQLPDGSQYSFTYDSYGELQTVTLPTGGVITYNYTNFLDSSYTENRWLSSRQVGSNAAMTFTPTVRLNCTNYSTGCLEDVNLHKPSGDETVYTLTLNNGAWNTGTIVYTGSAASGSSVEISSNTNTYTNTCTNPFTCYGANYLSQQLNSNILLSSTNLPTIYTQTLLTYSATNGKLTSQKQWDYMPWTFPTPTTPPSTTPTKEIDNIFTSYYDPYQIKVLDANGNQAGLTTYNYSSSAVTTSGLPNHNPASGLPVYLSSVSRWLNTGGSSTLTYNVYDTGQVQSITDANSNPPTTYTYQCGGSLPYTVTNPLNQTTQYGYDCNSGAMTSVQNPNDLAAGRAGTTYAYESQAGRLYTLSYPDGGLATATYPSATEVDTTVTATPDPSIASASIVDSFGRPYQQITAGNSTETSYDANGRAYCVTNPHAVGATSPGSTCISSYDGLDRPLVQSQPDGTNTLTWLYDENIVHSYDEASNQTTRTSDALGRLTSVVEANGAITTYAYDGLDNAKMITQSGISANGDVPRVRTFTYDSLSRLITSTNPETETICYGQWSGGSCQNGYDANGNLLHKTQANGIQTVYQYDVLNRLIQTNSNDNWVTINLFSYDTCSFSGCTNPIGHMTSEIEEEGWDGTEYSYDAMGRATSTKWISLLNGTVNPGGAAQYDLAGNPYQLVYPDGRTLTQNYDSAGRLTTVTDTTSGGAGTVYFSNGLYTAAGALQSATYGNGVTEANTYNSRLQPCHATVITPVLAAPSSGSGNLLDRTSSYAANPSFSSPCNAEPGNNGNIGYIADSLNTGWTQNFTYDGLNRLLTAYRSDYTYNPNSYNHNYIYDSFGNLIVHDNLNPNPTYSISATNQLNRINPVTQTSLYGYDAAGNLTSTDTSMGTGTSSIGGHNFTYNVNGQIQFVDNESTVYAYDALGQRVYRETGSWPFSYTEYVYFNGQPISETDQNGNWTDYIYTEGQKIAKVDNFDVRLHIAGACPSNTSACYTGWSIPAPTSYTVKSGDKLMWRQYETSGYGWFDVVFSNGVQTWQSWFDLQGDGEVMGLGVQSQWTYLSADLSPYAGTSMLLFALMVGTYPGPFDMLFGDIAIVSADGAVTPIYNRQLGITPGLVVNYGSATNLTAVSEQVLNSANPQTTDAATSTSYYLDDHLGTAQMELNSGGWPVWQGQFAPFGMELADGATSMHYKFTGKERDAETGDVNGYNGWDDFGARYYGALMARWVSPDPYNGSMDLSDPQSLNRYSYVNNMPLNHVDPDGTVMLPPGAPVGLLCGPVCAGVIAGIGLADSIYDLGRMLGWWGHAHNLTASTRPRPDAPNWLNSDTFNVPYQGIGGAIGGVLGAPGTGGCEFGGCTDPTSSFSAGTATAPASWCLEHPTICTVGVDLAAVVRAIPAALASAALLSMEGDNKPNPNRCQEVRQRAIAVCTDLHLDGMKDNSGPFFACIRKRMAAEGCGY